MLGLQSLHGEVILLLRHLLLGESHFPVVYVLLVILIGGIDICLSVFRKSLRCDIIGVRLCSGSIYGSGMAAATFSAATTSDAAVRNFRL